MCVFFLKGGGGVSNWAFYKGRGGGGEQVTGCLQGGGGK